MERSDRNLRHRIRRYAYIMEREIERKKNTMMIKKEELFKDGSLEKERKREKMRKSIEKSRLCHEPGKHEKNKTKEKDGRKMYMIEKERKRGK